MEAMKSLARQSPNAVMQFFGGSVSQNGKPATSSINLPPINQQKEDSLKPERSLMAGASSKEQEAYLAKVRDSIYKKHGIENN